MKRINPVLLLIPLMLGCEKSTSPPVEEQAYFLQGTVVDSTTGFPIPNATVAIRNLSSPDSAVFDGDSATLAVGTILKTTQTSYTGEFQFEFVPGGRDTSLIHQLFAFKTGFRLWRYDRNPVPVTAVNKSTDKLSISLATPPVRYYFGPTFKVGTSWLFNHTNFDNDPAYCHREDQWGTHRWTITSVSVASGDTTFLVDLIRQDSVHRKQQQCYPGQAVYDTTYQVTDTTQFTIVISKEMVTFNWPSAYRYVPVYAQDAHSISRIFINQLPGSITVGIQQSQFWYDYATYTNTQGPTLYAVQYGGSHTYGEQLTMISFTNLP